MSDGIYTALSGSMVMDQNLEVLGNNLANISTPGFKAQRPVFESVLVQDIAFFDGMRTGDLQQRMSTDVRAMSSPLFSALPILLSNMILLIGGIVMCFYTSWRLSMLAFTTVLPFVPTPRADGVARDDVARAMTWHVR